MKKILSIILMIALIATVASTIATSAGAEIVPLNSYDVFEDWEDYKVTESRVQNDAYILKEDGSKGDYLVHYEYPHTQREAIKVANDPTDSGRGKVAYMNNRMDGNSTYTNFSYDPQGTNKLVARNYTVTMDVYVVSGGLTGSPWFGFNGRVGKAGEDYIKTSGVIANVQNGTGESTDILRSGRVPTAEDVYYQLQPFVSSNTGSVALLGESGINKSFSNWYRTDGGDVAGCWYNYKVEVRENYMTVYIREDARTDLSVPNEEPWHNIGTAVFKDPNNERYAGTFAILQCAGEYYYDNIDFRSEDAYDLSVSCDSVVPEGTSLPNTVPATAGTGYSIMKTAGADTDVELVMSGYDGYTFGKWYSDEEKTKEVTPVSIQLEEYVYDMAYGKYEWVTVTEELAQISTYEEMFAEIEVGDEIKIWNEHYAGSKYRLKVRANTVTDGYNFYGEFIKQHFTVNVGNDGNGTVSIDGFETLEDGSLQSRLVLEETATLIATPNPGYQFAGWYEQLTVGDYTYVSRMSTEAEYIYTQTAVHTVKIVAVFVPDTMVKHTINITTTILNEGNYDYGKVVAGAGEFYHGEEITLIVTENTGFAFLGFYIDEYAEENRINSPDEDVYLYIPYVVDRDVNIIAVYEIETYRIRIVDGLGGEERIEEVQKGSAITLVAAPAPKGYSFTGWTVDGASYEQLLTDRKVSFDAESRTVYARANYAPVTSRVRVTCVKQKVIDPTTGKPTDEEIDVVKAIISSTGTSTSYKYGDVITITPEMLVEGYCVSQYSVKGADATINEDGSLTFVLGDEDVTIRIDTRSIDVIAVDNEIFMYVVFLAIGLVIVGALLFANNKDKQRERQ